MICVTVMIAAFTSAASGQEPAMSLIPQPAHIRAQEGVFALTADTVIVTTGNTRDIGQYLAELLEPATGFKLDVTESAPHNRQGGYILLADTSGKHYLGCEGYDIKVMKNRIFINARTTTGVFYACQTLRQLLPPEIEGNRKVENVSWTIPQLEIEDKPRFQWRGSLLDCCRHFMTVDFVKRYIDLLAYHKMNRLHWHLTEDQGWRIEIRKYPKITEIGAWRLGGVGYLPAPDDPAQANAARYGGYYTQDDIREIVRYAESRCVMVVPEIEMPGHCQAALAAYPQLSCTGGPFKVRTARGISKDVYCAGKEQTFEFLENVLSEVIELFPSPYIHIGGDECPKDRWKQCPDCQARIKAENLEDEHQLQSYFIKRIEKFLLGKGRRLIGWDEILEGGLAPSATVQSWRGVEGAVSAAKSGHDAIVSPTSHCYFDYPHSDREKNSLSMPNWMRVLPVEKVYSFEPVPEGLTAQQKRHILGGEGNIWTEFAPQQEVESRVYPRMTALAEVLWSPQNKRNWQDFAERLNVHYQRFDNMGVNYYRDKVQ